MTGVLIVDGGNWRSDAIVLSRDRHSQIGDHHGLRTQKPAPRPQNPAVGPLRRARHGRRRCGRRHPRGGVGTAARRPAPSHRDSTAVRHINVDLLDREGTRKALSKLDTVTDLVFAAYVEKPTMAATVEPNARMLQNTLDAFAARDVPLRRVVLAGGAKSYGFHLGSFNPPAIKIRDGWAWISVSGRRLMVRVPFRPD